MAKVTLPPGIASISGAMGPFMYKTFKKPDGMTETRVYPNPYYRVRQSGRKNSKHGKDK